MAFCCTGCKSLLFISTDIHAVQPSLHMTRVARIRRFTPPISSTTQYGDLRLLVCGGCSLDIGAVERDEILFYDSAYAPAEEASVTLGDATHAGLRAARAETLKTKFAFMVSRMAGYLGV